MSTLPMGANGWGLPDSVLSAWEKRQKLADTLSGQKARETVKAANKSSAPKVAGPSWWEQLTGAFNKYAPLGFGIPGTGNIGEVAVVKPAIQKVGDALPSVDFGGYVKWVVVGLVALAALVVVPRIIPR